MPVQYVPDLWLCGQSKCCDSSLDCNILGMKFIDLWPQTQSSTFISALASKVFVSTFSAEQPKEKFQNNQREGGRAKGRRPQGRECCCNRKFLHSVWIFESLHLWSVEPANRRTEDQPNSSTTGTNLFQKLLDLSKCNNGTFFVQYFSKTLPKKQT